MSKNLTEEQQKAWNRLKHQGWNGEIYFDHNKALENPVIGTLFLNSADNKAYIYDGTDWVEIK